MRFRKGKSKIYKLPNRKKKLITDDFLITFKKEIDKKINADYNVENTYWGMYFHIENSKEVHEAFKVSCIKHNILHALYNYSESLKCDDLEIFNDIIFSIMIDRNIIIEGNIYDGIPDYKDNDMEIFELIEKVKKYKGYNVKIIEWAVKEKGIIENILNE